MKFKIQKKLVSNTDNKLSAIHNAANDSDYNKKGDDLSKHTKYLFP